MSEEKTNQYNESWNANNGYIYNRLESTDGNDPLLGFARLTGLFRDDKKSLAASERIVKLMNLFAGVSDEVIDALVTMRSEEQKLAIAVLQNPLDKTPLCMLIDAVQDTPQYQAQTACYRSWQQFYDLVYDVAERLRTASDKNAKSVYPYPDNFDVRKVANELFRFIAFDSIKPGKGISERISGI